MQNQQAGRQGSKAMAWLDGSDNDTRGFQLVIAPIAPMAPTRTVCATYSYVNADSPTFTNFLWGYQGQVAFQSRSECTPWHGTFRIDEQQVITILFDCRGRLPFKSVVLTPRAENLWEGFDYAGRHITLRRIEAAYLADGISWGKI